MRAEPLHQASMLILGINGGTASEMDDEARQQRGHDSAAVLLRGGEVLAAVEEERLSRVPHCNYFPRRAIRRCLESHRLTLSDIAFVAVNSEEHTCELDAARRYLNDPASQARDARQLYGGLFAHEFGTDVGRKLRFCNHHLAHAWSAYGCAGFDDALVVVLDGEGDFASGAVYDARGGHLTALRDHRLDQSLGRFCSSVIRLLGYPEFDHHKATGLAPHGDAQVYGELFSGLYQLLPKGNYHLADRLTCMRRLERAGLLDAARRQGEPFTQRHTHIAAALQVAVETIVAHVLRHFRAATGHERLCLAGTIAQNVHVNAAVLRLGLFTQVFVQPAAGDAGGALGAALAVLHEERAKSRCPAAPALRLEHLALGTDAEPPGGLAPALQAWGDLVTVTPAPHLTHDAASLLAAGQVIGWVQGRAEFGPRALGQRSILADPCAAPQRQRINRTIKRREAFRPLEAAVQRDRLATYFELPPTEADLSFMTYALKLHEPMRPRLAAIAHVDGQAWVQAVARERQPLFWGLIEEFARLTGLHVLLNTALGSDVEPLVDSVDDAMACLLTSGLDALVIGSYVVRRRDLGGSLAPFEPLVPWLPPGRRLVQAPRLCGPGELQTAYRIDGTMDRPSARPPVDLPVDVWRLLHLADGRRSVGDLMQASGLGPAEQREVLECLLRLWCDRWVTLLPAAAARRAAAR